ncbi:UMP kinase [Candidatus Pacearchaeota archaeon CG10_big_fil_rev_8_21_14_0_10_30_48]|nr:MAG: UMP kinase [Candidatus Pacearchaeota archaeon CG10_big_fil_rev_8_21_14_0_10_30_48]
MKENVVISLGGSQIIKDNKINVSFLEKFKEILNRHKSKYNFIVVCGGGSVARMYISGLKKQSEKLQSFAGISVTRTNARFMSYFFGNNQLEGIPHTMIDVKKLLKKQDMVFCGALEYRPHQTSDSTAAQIASELNAEFVNITNVDGLYTGNPSTSKNVKFIPKISWKEFHKIASKISFKPGQHFVLDQKASKIIMEKKIKTYIVGNNLENLNKVLNEKDFRGTLIVD